MKSAKTIKTIILVILVTFFPLTLSAGPNPDLQLSEEEKDWIRAHPTLTVANEMDWPPFDFVDTDEPQGYSIDLIRLIALKTGWKPKFVNGFTWAELLDKFKAGEIDIMPAIYLNDERKKFTAFTRSYVSQPSVIVVRKENVDIVDIASLSGKRVAGIVDFAITNALKTQVPSIKLIPVDNAIDGIKTVSLGKADAMVDSIGVVTHILENNFIPNIRALVNVDLKQISNPALHMGVEKNNIILRDILNKALLSLSKEEKSRLRNRWFHIAAGEQKIKLSKELQAWVDNHPVIRIGIDGDYAPYSFSDESGGFRGIAPDFIKIIGQRLGIKFEPVPNLSWAEIIEGSRKRTLDVVATAVSTPERRQFLNFTPIYINTPLVIMTRTEEDKIVSPNDLDGRNVALVKKYSSSQRVVKEHAGVQPVWVANPTEGLRSVATGKADAYVGVLGVNIYLGQKNGITNLKVAGRYDSGTNGQGFAVRSDWPELVLALNEALQSISEEERISIFDKWVRIRYEEKPDYSLFWKSIAVFLIIVALLFFYIRKLTGEVKRRKIAEKKLQVTNKTAIEARKMADEANTSKSLFLAKMSHELRTPMNAILGFGQLMKFSKIEPLSNSQNKNIDRILNAGDHLLELIDDVLDLSRIESGTFNLSIEDVNLTTSMNSALALIQPEAAKLEVKIENNLDPHLCVRADPTRLKQVLLNLLSNGVKYNKRQGKVTLGCKITSNDKVRVTITDTGLGITEEKKKFLFQPFNRLGAEATEVKGTGIGLTISKRLVEMMEGSLTLASTIGQGSCFAIELPMGKSVECESEVTQSISPIKSNGKNQYSVLFVEDNLDNLELVQDILSEQPNIKFLSASRAQLGIDIALSHRPQLILMDIDLPDMSGIEAIEKLKSFDETRDIPVVAVSANAMKRDIDKAMAAGFKNYIVKPINIPGFIKTIGEVLNNRTGI